MNETTFSRKLMGGLIEITLYEINSDLALPLLEETYEEGLRLQKIFNFFDSESELSLLNKKRSKKVSKELLEVISKALEYCKKTKGKYDLSIGKQIIQRKKGEEVKPIKSSYKNIIIKGNEISLNHEDVLIDLGSIAKGYIVDKLVEFLIKKGVKNGLVDARGDIRAFGNKQQVINIQHLRDKSKIIYPFTLKNSGVATSGDYNQYYGDHEKSHILGKNDLISVTVISKKLAEADVLATSILVLNEDEVEKFIKLKKDFQVLTIDKKLSIKVYNKFPLINQ